MGNNKDGHSKGSNIENNSQREKTMADMRRRRHSETTMAGRGDVSKRAEALPSTNPAVWKNGNERTKNMRRTKVWTWYLVDQ